MVAPLLRPLGDTGKGELGHDPHFQSLAETKDSFHLDFGVLCAGLLSNPSAAGDLHILLSISRHELVSSSCFSRTWEFGSPKPIWVLTLTTDYLK